MNLLYIHAPLLLYMQNTCMCFRMVHKLYTNINDASESSTIFSSLLYLDIA